jgi:hypothetical protein
MWSLHTFFYFFLQTTQERLMPGNHTVLHFWLNFNSNIGVLFDRLSTCNREFNGTFLMYIVQMPRLDVLKTFIFSAFMECEYVGKINFSHTHAQKLVEADRRNWNNENFTLLYWNSLSLFPHLRFFQYF